MLDTATLKNPRVIIPATLATVAATLLLPFLVHLLPPSGGVPLGARLLPLFIAPFLAVVLFHPAVALVASLVTPLLNRLLTGQPAWEMSVLLTVELFTFSLAAWLLVRRWPKFWGNAPLAYVIAKAASLLLLSVLPLLPVSPWRFFGSSLQTALPGVLVLLVLNFIVVRVWRTT